MKQPTPDGVMTIYLNSDPTCSPMIFEHRDVVFMHEEMIGLRVVYVDSANGRRRSYFFPWSSINFTDNLVSSEEYRKKYEEWRELETVQAAAEGRKPTFLEREVCAGCGTDALRVLNEGLLH